MNYAILLMMLAAAKLTIVDFPDNLGTDWVNVDDGVMGGESQSKFTTDKSKNGVFYGVISLDNYGGFSSVRYRFDQINVTGYKKAFMRIKGDGKRYQFRVKSSSDEKHSYRSYFETSGEWEIIEIDLNAMNPAYRGMTPNIPNYEAESLAEVGFLIANKKAERFELKIDKIWLEKDS